MNCINAKNALLESIERKSTTKRKFRDTHLAVVHDQNLVARQDRVQPVRDRQHRALGKHVAYRLLHEPICLAVNRRRRFVEHDDARRTQYGARHAEQLTFADAEVFAVFDDFRFELVRKVADLEKKK